MFNNNRLVGFDESVSDSLDPLYEAGVGIIGASLKISHWSHFARTGICGSGAAFRLEVLLLNFRRDSCAVSV
jgi:hypothetical protein